MSKLTLRVPKELVSAAKIEAAARRVSVSQLVSGFFTTPFQKSAASDPYLECLAPRTRRLAGCITAADADIEDYIHY